MPASVVVKRNFPDLRKVELLTAQDMHDIGLLAREQIVRRTLRGLGADGHTFAPYAADYAALKGKALGGSATVNLQVSGNMLNDLQVTEARGWNDSGGPSVTLGWNA